MQGKPIRIFGLTLALLKWPRAFIADGLESDARDKSPLLLPAFLRVASKGLPDTHGRVDAQSVPNRRRYAALVRERL
jgi:hypothetical protein